MRTATVFYNRIAAGTLTEESRTSYIFTYDDSYFKDSGFPTISLTLPKSQQVYRSTFLFPFFYNMLAEGVNRSTLPAS